MTQEKWDALFYKLMGAIVGASLGSLLFPVHANAADADYCRLYSREMVRAWVRTIPAADLPNITVNTLAYRLTLYEAACAAHDTEPVIKDLPSDGQWTLGMLSDIQRSLPHPHVADIQPSATRPPPPAIPAPLARKVVVAAPTNGSSAPQPLCSSHHMQTIYSGLHWRCQ